MQSDTTPESLQARLAAVLRESKRLRAETVSIVEQSRAWSDAVATNIREAPRWTWNGDQSVRIDPTTVDKNPLR